MRIRRADRRNDSLADTRQHGIFARASDQLLDIGANRYAGLGDQLDTVLGHGSHGRRIDHFRIDRHLDRFGHVTAGQIDRGRHAEIERNVRFLGRNKCRYHIGDVAARQIVRFQIVRGQVQPRFRSRDQLVDDHRGGDLAETHQHQLNQADPHARYQRGKPQADRDKVKNEPQQHERHEGHDNPNSQFHTIYLLKVQYNSHNRTRLP